MQPDPQRQWFVYYKEKEMGPFSETDLKGKLVAKEIDEGAYLFTEGMTDWTLVQELAIFRPEPVRTAASSPAQSPVKASVQQAIQQAAQSSAKPAYQPEEVRAAAEPTQRVSLSQAQATPAASPSAPAAKTEKTSATEEIPSPEAPSENIAKKIPAEKTQSARRKWFSAPGERPKWFLPALLALLVASVAYYWWDQQPPAPKASDEEVAATEDGAPTDAPKTPRKASGPDVAWDELLAARLATGQGSPFRIEASSVSASRPVILGAVSTAIRADYLHVMVFPDNDRNLLPVVRVWYFLVPVIDGLFSVGPLNLEGEPLPAGTYHVMIAHKGTYLGEAGFEHGVWPSNQELSQIQAKLEQDRSVLAQKEKGALETKLQQVQNASQQLEILGRTALKGKIGRSEWTTGAEPWRSAFWAALEEQRKIVVSPTFYRGEQMKLYEVMDELFALYNALDRASKVTPQAFAKSESPGIGERWATFRKNLEAFSGGLRVLSDAPTEKITIDREALKKQLESQRE